MQQGRIALGAWIGFIPHMRHFETGPRSGFPLGMQWIYCLKAALCHQNTRINERDSNIELTQNHQPIDMLQAPLRALGEGAWLVQELGTKADFWAGSKTQSCNASHSICDALGDIHQLSATDQTYCLKKSNAIEWHRMALNGTECHWMAPNTTKWHSTGDLAKSYKFNLLFGHRFFYFNAPINEWKTLF